MCNVPVNMPSREAVNEPGTRVQHRASTVLPLWQNLAAAAAASQRKKESDEPVPPGGYSSELKAGLRGVSPCIRVFRTWMSLGVIV